LIPVALHEVPVERLDEDVLEVGILRGNGRDVEGHAHLVDLEHGLLPEVDGAHVTLWPRGSGRRYAVVDVGLRG
jgi:hypothetical protein